MQHLVTRFTAHPNQSKSTSLDWLAAQGNAAPLCTSAGPGRLVAVRRRGCQCFSTSSCLAAVATVAVAVLVETCVPWLTTSPAPVNDPAEVNDTAEGTANPTSGQALDALAPATQEEDSAQEANATTDTWEAMLDAGFQKMKLELDLTRDGDQLAGTMRSPDQTNRAFPLRELVLTEKELKFKVPQLGVEFEAELDKTGKVAKGTFRQSGMEFPLEFQLKRSRNAKGGLDAPAESLKEAWVGKLEIGLMKPVMQFRVVETDAGEKAYFDSVTEGRTDFPAAITRDGDRLRFEVESIRLKFAGTLSADQLQCRGTWSQGGRELPLTLTRQEREFDNKLSWENRPQKPERPYPYDEVEVEFENRADKIKLAGTLTVPRRPGRHPVVILISGSGQQDRDETLMEHKPFLVLADYLTRRGIAVLRYDDRGVGGSGGGDTLATATTADFARDTAAAVDFLRKHDRIDPQQIGLCGHSEGGLIAPMVAGERDDVAWVILMAAPGVSGPEIIRTQTEAMLKSTQMPQEDIDRELRVSQLALRFGMQGQAAEKDFDQAIDELIQQFASGDNKAGETNFRNSGKLMKSMMQRSWMQYFLQYDPKPALRAMRCPVLAIQGSKDLQVLPDVNVPHIREALTAGGNRDSEVITLEGLNHMFQECETGSPLEYGDIEETFNPRALQAIGDWLEKRASTVR